MIREETCYCCRECSTSPKKEWALQMSHFHISPNHIAVLAYTLVIGFSLGKAPSSLVGGGGCLHPTLTCCESLCKCSAVEALLLAHPGCLIFALPCYHWRFQTQHLFEVCKAHPRRKIIQHLVLISPLF